MSEEVNENKSSMNKLDVSQPLVSYKKMNTMHVTEEFQNNDLKNAVITEE